MAREPETGRWAPGESPNPGGRPRAALAQSLYGRRARRALVDLLRAIGPGLTVVVLDARGLVLGDVLGDGGSRRAGLDELDELAPPCPPDPVAAAARAAWATALLHADAELAAAGWHQVAVDRPLPGSVASTWTDLRWHGPAGADVGFVDWVRMRDEIARKIIGQSAPA